MPTTRLPTLTSYVDQNWFLEPLKGPQHPRTYLDHFPSEVYNTGPDSHLTKFLYVLLGPSGVGYLRQNALEARLKLEELGLELFDLDAFYGDPLRFARALDEVYDEDPRGLIDRDAWDLIRARDAKYRSRILDFLDGVRAGNTPLGMHYVARSGLGHEVSIIENYKALFDERSDDPLGLVNYGKTRFLEEMIVLPRREVSISEVQQIAITGSPTGGTFTIDFNGGTTAAIAWNAPAQNIQTFLEALPNILPGDVEVTGGPGPGIPWKIRFMGTWSARNVPQVRTNSSLTGGTTPLIQSSTLQSGVDAADEVVHIAPRDQHHLQEAIDRLRPQSVITTVGEASGLRARQLWAAGRASSEYDEVVRFVNGKPDIPWPARDNINWIERNVERRSPKAIKSRSYEYENYHNVTGVVAYTDEALVDPVYTVDNPTTVAQYPSEHIGPFSEYQRGVFPFLTEFDTISRFGSELVLSDYVQPLTITDVITDPDTDSTLTQLINGIYPVGYTTLPGIPAVKYDYEQFWASRERSEGIDYLEIDLGIVKAVNILQFEITQKPVDITLSFEVLDQGTRRRFEPVVLDASHSSNAAVNFLPENTNPWSFNEYSFANANDELIFTRYIRIGFSRRNNLYSPFYIEATDEYRPWSVDVRNLRIGRSITNIH